MNKIIDRYLFIIFTNLKLPKIQVLSHNQSLYHFIINKKEQQATFVLVRFVKEELLDREYEIKFNTSSFPGRQMEINHYLSTEFYLYKLKAFPANGGVGLVIQTKKMFHIN